MPSTSTISPARQVAMAVLRRVDEGDAFADRALSAEASRAELEPRERAFATALVYGVVQRQRTLDRVIATLAGRPVAQLDALVRDALRLGCLQLLFLDGVAAHAAVDQSVELVKRAPGAAARGAGLVNAVLRRAAKEGSALIAALDDDTPRAAAQRHSVPDWLATMWWDDLGPADARALLARINEPAEGSLRINTLVAEPAAVLAELTERGVPLHAAGSALPEGLVLDGAFDVAGDPLWASGALAAQSRAAMHAARLLAPASGMRVLDLCAAPGGKSTHLAALMGGKGEVVAVERHPGRARALREACDRLHATCVRVEVGDASEPRGDGPFDAVLIDPPCSGLGTLQGRPDLRWRIRKNTLPALAALQQRILTAGAEALRPGGALLYATCTISRQENEDVIRAFLAANPGFELDDLGASHPAQALPGDARMLQFLPHRDSTDGFFLARLRRTV